MSFAFGPKATALMKAIGFDKTKLVLVQQQVTGKFGTYIKGVWKKPEDVSSTDNVVNKPKDWQVAEANASYTQEDVKKLISTLPPEYSDKASKAAKTYVASVLSKLGGGQQAQAAIMDAMSDMGIHFTPNKNGFWGNTWMQASMQLQKYLYQHVGTSSAEPATAPEQTAEPEPAPEPEPTSEAATEETPAEPEPEQSAVNEPELTLIKKPELNAKTTSDKPLQCKVNGWKKKAIKKQFDTQPDEVADMAVDVVLAWLADHEITGDCASVDTAEYGNFTKTLELTFQKPYSVQKVPVPYKVFIESSGPTQNITAQKKSVFAKTKETVEVPFTMAPPYIGESVQKQYNLSEGQMAQIQQLITPDFLFNALNNKPPYSAGAAEAITGCEVIDISEGGNLFLEFHAKKPDGYQYSMNVQTIVPNGVMPVLGKSDPVIAPPTGELKVDTGATDHLSYQLQKLSNGEYDIVSSAYTSDIQKMLSGFSNVSWDTDAILQAALTDLKFDGTDLTLINKVKISNVWQGTETSLPKLSVSVTGAEAGKISSSAYAHYATVPIPVVDNNVVMESGVAVDYSMCNPSLSMSSAGGNDYSKSFMLPVGLEDGVNKQQLIQLAVANLSNSDKKQLIKHGQKIVDAAIYSDADSGELKVELYAICKGQDKVKQGYDTQDTYYVTIPMPDHPGLHPVGNIQVSPTTVGFQQLQPYLASKAAQQMVQSKLGDNGEVQSIDLFNQNMAKVTVLNKTTGKTVVMPMKLTPKMLQPSTGVTLSDQKKLYNSSLDVITGKPVADSADAALGEGEILPASMTYEQLKVKYFATDIFATPKQADKDLRPAAGIAWLASTSAEKKAINKYTGGAYSSMNALARGGWNSPNTTSNPEYKSVVDCTSMISHSVLDHDVKVRRGVTFNDVARMLDLPAGTKLTKDTDYTQFIDMHAHDEGFASCGCTQGTGFDKEINLEILVPAGTQAMYCEPISKCGSGDGLSWDGFSQQQYFSSELELLLQRGTHFRVIGQGKSVPKKYGGGMVPTLQMIVTSQNPLP